MKTLFGILVITMGLLAMPITWVHAEKFTPDDLEPCINGAVSASGLYPSQELEDMHKTRTMQATDDPVHASSFVSARQRESR